MGFAAHAGGRPGGSGGTAFASGCSDHQARSPFARSRTTTPAGHTAPAATHRRSVATSTAVRLLPSFGIRGGSPSSDGATRSSSPLSSGLPGTTYPPARRCVGRSSDTLPLAFPGWWQRTQCRSRIGATSLAKSTTGTTGSAASRLTRATSPATCAETMRGELDREGRVEGGCVTVTDPVR